MALLKEEISFFEANQAKWREIYLDKFALIKGRELVGVFDSSEKGLSEGIRLYGSDPFLVRPITLTEQIINIPALYLGLLHAPVALSV